MIAGQRARRRGRTRSSRRVRWLGPIEHILRGKAQDRRGERRRQLQRGERVGDLQRHVHGLRGEQPGRRTAGLFLPRPRGRHLQAHAAGERQRRRPPRVERANRRRAWTAEPEQFRQREPGGRCARIVLDRPGERLPPPFAEPRGPRDLVELAGIRRQRGSARAAPRERRGDLVPRGVRRDERVQQRHRKRDRLALGRAQLRRGRHRGSDRDGATRAGRAPTRAPAAIPAPAIRSSR